MLSNKKKKEKTTTFKREKAMFLEKTSKQIKPFVSCSKWILLERMKTRRVWVAIWPTGQLQSNRIAHSFCPLMPSYPSISQMQARQGVCELRQPGAGSLVPCFFREPLSPLPSCDWNTNMLSHERQKEQYHPLVAPSLLTWPAPAERWGVRGFQ